MFFNHETFLNRGKFGNHLTHGFSVCRCLWVGALTIPRFRLKIGWCVRVASEKSVKILRYLTHCISTFNFLYFLTALPFASVQNQNKELYWKEFFRPIISHTFFAYEVICFDFEIKTNLYKGLGEIEHLKYENKQKWTGKY